jgi:hypothetical protein
MPLLEVKGDRHNFYLGAALGEQEKSVQYLPAEVGYLGPVRSTITPLPRMLPHRYILDQGRHSWRIALSESRRSENFLRCRLTA